eukprot:TRINITY_DN69913_c0_g1_i1.p1 TRINITY_DN69913_c0_g1~~TRINITY_DN69913_c0_g1_i1.p1  ORF type:complete len:209 (-),score=14.98 TRINITY_DN69913_c0_g1_i1:113-739(-)
MRTSLGDISNIQRPTTKAPVKLIDQVAQHARQLQQPKAQVSLSELRALLPLCRQPTAQQVLRQHAIPEKLTNLLDSDDKTTLVFVISCLANIISCKPKTGTMPAQLVNKLVSLIGSEHEEVSSLATQCMSALADDSNCARNKFFDENGPTAVSQALVKLSKKPLGERAQPQRNACFSNRCTRDREFSEDCDDTLAVRYMHLLRQMASD